MGGFSIAGGTIPPHIYVTSQRPDLVVVREELKQMIVMELTVPFETNVEEAHKRKIDRYKDLISDLTDETGYKVSFYAIEVGLRGHIDNNNKQRLKKFLKDCNFQTSPKPIFDKLCKLAVVSSFVIFYARKEMLWGDVQYLDV